MIPRAASRQETRLRIIQAAANLFHQQGINLTRPADVISASKARKGQFYYFFRNKTDLVHQVLQHHLQAIQTRRSAIDCVDSWQGLEDWFERHMELQKSFHMTRACPIATVGNELTANDELLRDDVKLILDAIRDELAEYFAKEKSQGRLQLESCETALGWFCIAAVQGALLLGKITRNSHLVEMAVHEAVAHLRRYKVGAESAKTACGARPSQTDGVAGGGK